ncbi:hypothetical protein QJS10_CPA02g01161 [Acorus calamus]|uniref:Uncharacterized protein n=1 Tax=Acorus calamus TaxID=4465 RepID=A0AAV9FE21_ACOCL|nr:hypothetical protein QJS10_CPA02g01161 [Acorus calamus]
MGFNCCVWKSNLVKGVAGVQNEGGSKCEGNPCGFFLRGVSYDVRGSYILVSGPGEHVGAVQQEYTGSMEGVPPAEDDGGGDDVISGGGNDWILVGDGDGGGDRTGILKDEEARVSVAVAAAASDSPPLGGGGEIKVLEDVEEAEEEPVIPGLSRSPLEADAKVAADVLDKEEDLGGAGGDDWESDSEDDLRIVLNETRGPIGGGLQRNGRIGGSDEEDDDDDDEDGEDLVIVADDGDQPRPPMMEEQEWGEEVAPQPGMDGMGIDGLQRICSWLKGIVLEKSEIGVKKEKYLEVLWSTE